MFALLTSQGCCEDKVREKKRQQEERLNGFVVYFPYDCVSYLSSNRIKGWVLILEFKVTGLTSTQFQPSLHFPAFINSTI